jgi:hypothetical protein
VLSPEKENGEVVYDPAIPYTGAVYVERKTEIESGLTQAVPVEAIREFIKSQTPLLREKGYLIGNIFKTE